MSSRSVSLTSTFLLLAAGGAAACDSNRYHNEGFYCADANGVVVDERYCDDTNRYGGGGYYIYHSPSYLAGYPIGYRLPSGGSRFAYNDQSARTSFGLPATGKVGNGTIKTNVVGKGGSAKVGSGSHGSGSHGSGAKSGG